MKTPLLILCVAAAMAGPASAQTPLPRTAAESLLSVDPGAGAAALAMANELRGLGSFQVVSHATIDEVIDDQGTRITLAPTIVYKVRRPEGFLIEYTSDQRTRRLVYDGSTLTVDLPRQGYYAQVAATGPNYRIIDTMADDYGIILPLADLFYWGVDERTIEDLDTAVWLGSATVNGKPTSHYLFRRGDLAYQVWIASTGRPLPLKIAITTLSDPAKPNFTAELEWNTEASFTDADFRFRPGADARPIALALLPEGTR